MFNSLAFGKSCLINHLNSNHVVIPLNLKSTHKLPFGILDVTLKNSDTLDNCSLTDYELDLIHSVGRMTEEYYDFILYQNESKNNHFPNNNNLTVSEINLCNFESVVHELDQINLKLILKQINPQVSYFIYRAC